MRNTKTYLPQKTLVAILIGSLVLTGCGGGGGGGGSSSGSGGVIIAPGNSGTSSNPSGSSSPTPSGTGGSTTTPSTSNPVPFYTPVRVGDYTTTTSTTTATNYSAMYAHDLNNDGTQEIVVAGRNMPINNTSTPYAISVWGWSNGSLQDLTSRYFSAGDNIIPGSEPSVHFADFNGDGKKDIYIAPSVDDGNLLHPEVAFINSGSGTFTRRTMSTNGVYAHDATVYDLNRDGRSDIVTTAMTFHFGNADGTFTSYNANTLINGNAGIVAADFMGNGGSSIILTESVDYGGVNSNKANRLLSWDVTNGVLNVHQVSELPTPRFLLPKWNSYNFGGAHDVRALAFDFDNSGLTDAVIFSRPRPVVGTTDWPKYSEVQFLLNKGGGVFQDVTDTTLVGYNTNTHVTYNPQLFDVNNDGLTDIVLSNPQWAAVEGVQVLLHTREHKYVSSYSNILQAFQTQSIDIERALGNAGHQGGNGVVFLQGPDSEIYVATGVDYIQNGNTRKAIYVSKLGTSTLNAQATATAIKQQWPWMSDAQVNQVLASSSTSWFNLSLLDSNKALSLGPIGPIGVQVNGVWKELTGSIGGIALNGAAKNFIISDSLNRTFSVDYGVSNFNMSHFWSQNISDSMMDDTRSVIGQRMHNMQVNQMQLSSAYRSMGFSQSQLGHGWFDEATIKMGSNQDYSSINPYTGQAPSTAYTYGITNIKPLSDRNFSMNLQYSNLPFSPFVQMTGVWGRVASADMLEASASYRHKGLVGKVGAINSYSTLDSGLVSKVSPITSVWGEVGHEWRTVQAYVGMLPKAVSGEATISMPTGVDRQGNTQYTSVNAGVNTPVVGYARVQMFNFTDRARTKSYSLNGIVSTDNNKAIMANFTHRF